jgi:23S rRNA (guanine745-N1)-methyltransferase
VGDGRRTCSGVAEPNLPACHAVPLHVSTLDDAFDILQCPSCGEPLQPADGGATCANRHHFDQARQGYLSLRAAHKGKGAPASGDTAEMLEARQRFQADGIHDDIAAAVLAAVPAGAPSGTSPTSGGWLADLGGGTGWYASKILDARPTLRGVVLDASAPAVRIAARAHERLAGVSADVWAGIPLRDASVGLALRIFAPGSADEVQRILAPGGTAVFVVPHADHLRELGHGLKLMKVPAGKAEEVAASIPTARLVSSHEVRNRVQLSIEQALDAVFMGPNAFHQDRAKVDKVLAEWKAPISVTIAVTVVALQLD